MDWIQQWQSKLNKQNGVAPLVRTGGSRHTGLAALPYRNIHVIMTVDKSTENLKNHCFLSDFQYCCPQLPCLPGRMGGRQNRCG